MPPKRKQTHGEDEASVSGYGSDPGPSSFQAAAQTKTRIDSHKKRREERRKVIESCIDEVLVALPAAIDDCTGRFRERRNRIKQERLSRLINAVKALEQKQLEILQKVNNIRTEFANLATILDDVYKSKLDTTACLQNLQKAFDGVTKEKENSTKEKEGSA